MSDTTIQTSGAAGRYAIALFELAEEQGSLDQTERDMESLDGALKDSDDLHRLIASPIYTREQQAAGVGAVAAKMGLSELVQNVLGLMAARRRIYMLPQLIAIHRALMARHRGQVTAEVTAATELSDAQSAKLAETLKAAEGKDVKLNVTVDESIIGGLIVKVGSKMIDTSIRSKLAGLQSAMKEVG